MEERCVGAAQKLALFTQGAAVAEALMADPGSIADASPRPCSAARAPSKGTTTDEAQKWAAHMDFKRVDAKTARVAFARSDGVSGALVVSEGSG